MPATKQKSLISKAAIRRAGGKSVRIDDDAFDTINATILTAVASRVNQSMLAAQAIGRKTVNSELVHATSPAIRLPAKYENLVMGQPPKAIRTLSGNNSVSADAVKLLNRTMGVLTGQLMNQVEQLLPEKAKTVTEKYLYAAVDGMYPILAGSTAGKKHVIKYMAYRSGDDPNPRGAIGPKAGLVLSVSRTKKAMKNVIDKKMRLGTPVAIAMTAILETMLRDTFRTLTSEKTKVTPEWLYGYFTKEYRSLSSLVRFHDSKREYKAFESNEDLLQHLAKCVYVPLKNGKMGHAKLKGSAKTLRDLINQYADTRHVVPYNIDWKRATRVIDQAVRYFNGNKDQKRRKILYALTLVETAATTEGRVVHDEDLRAAAKLFSCNKNKKKQDAKIPKAVTTKLIKRLVDNTGTRFDTDAKATVHDMMNTQAVYATKCTGFIAEINGDDMVKAEHVRLSTLFKQSMP